MATSQSVLHHDVLLSQYVQHWMPPQDKDVTWFVADDLFPTVSTPKASDVYKVINQSTFMQTGRAKVGANGDVATVQAHYDPEGSFKTFPYALDGKIDHLERSMADDAAKYEQLQTDLPMTVLKNTLEVDALTEILTTGNLGTSYETVGADDRADNYATLTGNPLLYIRRKCERVMNVTGRKPNLVLMDRLTLRAMKFHPAVQMIAPVHTVPAGLQEVTVKMLEEKLSDVLSPGAIKVCHFRYDSNSVPIAQASLAPKSAIGPNLIIAYVEPPNRTDIGATKQFAFVGDKDYQADKTLVGDNHNAAAPIAAYTYPIYQQGQRGATAIRVLTNRVFKIVRTSSLYVAFSFVDGTNTSLYGSELA